MAEEEDDEDEISELSDELALSSDVLLLEEGSEGVSLGEQDISDSEAPTARKAKVSEGAKFFIS
jgi:hypothetical protein